VPAIRLVDVSRTFPNGQIAVRDLTFEVASGELLTIVGPSGSGKSTVLRLIAGLDPVTSGRIEIDGHDVTAVSPRDRDVAMVFQSYALYPHMTVRENLAFGLRVRHTPRADIDAAVARTAEMLGLAALLERRPAQLSGGQRQRVAVGRALARNAGVYLLDEPLSNLDPQLRSETRTELGLLHRRLGATMVYVTHDQEEAMTLGTRIAVMRAGGLEQVGPPMELYRRPANRFVAQFLGTPAMNLLPATSERGDRDWRVTAALTGTRGLWAPAAVPLPARVEIGIRPHDVELCAEPDADAAGVVVLAEPLGAAVLLHVRPDRSPSPLVRLLAPVDAAATAGDRVAFRLSRDRVLVFDAESGALLV
jgi:multiple sugar transport system ATP-binding protein